MSKQKEPSMVVTFQAASKMSKRFLEFERADGKAFLVRVSHGDDDKWWALDDALRIAASNFPRTTGRFGSGAWFFYPAEALGPILQTFLRLGAVDRLDLVWLPVEPARMVRADQPNPTDYSIVPVSS